VALVSGFVPGDRLGAFRQCFSSMPFDYYAQAAWCQKLAGTGPPRL